MASILFESLASYNYKVLLRPNPIASLLDEAESNNQIRIQNPLSSTDYGLFVLKNKLNADRIFVPVLILIYWSVVAVFIRERASTVADPDVTPAKALCDFAVLRREGYRSATKILADVANLG